MFYMQILYIVYTVYKSLHIYMPFLFLFYFVSFICENLTLRSALELKRKEIIVCLHLI